jgi:hypothetical protein
MDESRSHDMTAAEFTLSSQCDTGLRRLFGANPSRLVLERLGHELDLIRRRGLAREFLTIASVVDAVRKSGSLVGPGRGASGSSLVCHLLGITGVDPMKYGLVFERLLPSPWGTLDIDIEVEDARRDSIAGDLGMPSGSSSDDGARIGAADADLVGQRALDRIAETIHLVEASGQLIDLSLIPLDDGQTFDLLRRASTRCVFQLGSLGTRRALRELQPTTFEDLIALLALYRPSAMSALAEFIRRSHGKPHAKSEPVVDAILDSTHGLIVYQEQVMQVAVQFSGFTGEQANDLRRALGYRDTQGLGEMRAAFLDGAQVRGYEGAAVRVWDALAQEAGSTVCKSHAVSRALLAYWDAYLAAHCAEAHATAASVFALSARPGLRVRERAEGWTAIDISIGSRELAALLPPPRAQEVALVAGSSSDSVTEYTCAVAARAALSGKQVVFRSFSPFIEEIRERLAQLPTITITAGGAAVAQWAGDEGFDIDRPRLLILDRIDLDESALDETCPNAVDQLGFAVSLAADGGECVVLATAVLAPRADGACRAHSLTDLGSLTAAEPYCDAVAFVEPAVLGTASTLRIEVLKSRWGSCGEATATVFSESDLREIDDSIGAYCRAESSPEDEGWRRMGYEVDESGATLFWEEPDRDRSGGWRRNPVARFSYNRIRGRWVLWWMSDDLSVLFPVPEQDEGRLVSLVAVVEKDEFGAFCR